MAEAKAQVVCVPMPSARARWCVRTHHRIIDEVRKNPAISHQPPWFREGMFKPSLGAGGSSASHGKSRRNRMGLQCTEAHMLSPMISMAMKPNSMETRPSEPR